MPDLQVERVRGPAGELSVLVQGDPLGPVVLMTHSILSSSRMWDQQASFLASHGFRVLRPDTRGHGGSQPVPPPYSLDDLAADSVAVLDAFNIERAHYVGLSLGAMSGFGMALQNPERLWSLCLCDARADAPPAFAAPWDERVAIAAQQGCGALAASTIERWFGQAFVGAHPAVAARLEEIAAGTSPEGFIGCARAIQALNYLPRLALIVTPCTLIVGAHDGQLPQAMRELQLAIEGSSLEIIPDAGHLPNVDQPDRFNVAMLRHLQSSAITR